MISPQLRKHVGPISDHFDRVEGEEWRSMTKRQGRMGRVKLDNLVATQDWYEPNKVEMFKRSSGAPPLTVYEHHGVHYLLDGHHRVIADKQRGLKTRKAIIWSEGAHRG